MIQQKIVFIGRENLKKNASTIRALGLSDYLEKYHFQPYLLLPDDEMNRNLKEKYFTSIRTILTSNSVLEPFHKLVILFVLKPDYIHCLNAGLNSTFVGIIYKLFNPETILIWDADELISELHNNKVRKKWLTINEYLISNFSDVIICASAYLKTKFQLFYRVNAHYLPYGINVENFISSEPINAIKNQKKITYLGTLQNYFDFSVLCNAILKASNDFPDWQFVFIGDGDQRKNLEEFKNKNLLHNFELKGFLPDDKVIEELNASNVFLLPLKDNEINKSRCPNKLFWYMAAGKPIVTNAVGEVNLILAEKGIYYQFDSVNDLLEKINVALASGKIEYNMMNVSWENRTSVYVKYLKNS